MASSFLEPEKSVPILTTWDDWECWILYIKLHCFTRKIWRYVDPSVSDKDMEKVREDSKAYKRTEDSKRDHNAAMEVIWAIYGSIDSQFEDVLSGLVQQRKLSGEQRRVRNPTRAVSEPL